LGVPLKGWVGKRKGRKKVRRNWLRRALKVARRPNFLVNLD